MGSSAESTGVVETDAGSIVWVRRRNGSWWPGKILGPEDLSASHVMSPRSGTPVKLLGREDASVDWYNLEKSKRVKAFRCGEFDDCIERAAASGGLPTKKREKYARREDAILHALELEKKFLEKKYGKSGRPNTVRENSSENEKRTLLTPVRALENGNGYLGNHELGQVDDKVDKSIVLETNNFSLYGLRAGAALHPSLAEQNALMGSQNRMLQDYGHKAVPLNRIICPVASDDSNRTAVDGHAYAVSVRDPCFETSSDSESRHSIDKGKRLLEGYVEEPLPKRHRALHSFVNVRHNGTELADHSMRPDMYAKGLPGDGFNCSVYMPMESPQMFNVKHGMPISMGMPISRQDMGSRRPQHGTSADESTAGSSEETESDSSETHSIETHVDAGMLVSDAETRIRPQQALSHRLEMQAGHEITSSDDSVDLSPDDRSQFHNLDPNGSGTGVSKWQLKGKRNVRSMSQRPRDGFSEKADLDSRVRSLNQRVASHGLGYYHDNGYFNDGEFLEDDFDPHMHGFRKREYLPFQAASKRQSYTGQNMIDWEEFTWGRPFRAYWEERGMFIGRNGRDMLIDVDLQVQANRQGEHAPWVSLMSKLDGKAIIGHPIQVEALEDGASDIIVSTSGELTYDSDRGKVPPMWRTARRTANFRVPRPPQLDVDATIDYQHLHQSGKVRSKKPLTPNSVCKGSLLKKNHAYLSKLPQGVKKASRKGNLPLNQKTKPLSSIGFDQKVADKPVNDGTSYIVDSVIKPVDSDPPTVACIPVKLVFSRLLEAVGRPPAGPANIGVSVNSNKERNPS